MPASVTLLSADSPPLSPSNPPHATPLGRFSPLPLQSLYPLLAFLSPIRSGRIRESPFNIKVMAETVDLTGDGGVLKTVVRKAKDDAISPSDSLPLVDVHYEGTLAENGEVFDTTHEDNSIFSFEVGQGAVIKAWDLALRTMKVGEVAKITCKPEYAYGSAGSPPEIPANATLIFEVELLACKPRKGSSLGSVSDEKARLE
ncbi:hypothetical protein BRADI_2g23380v3 [Brachypodium distachyon]|uniref:peptidylprolyl isomerase n=2 Tax=Brachypodium distachyon TaxID=15368 RepID=A0A0Q3IZW5_BRADI|nr:hypothetical protein BRADI_2g23380v3 [Brachypodium distachyon]